jgi:hypothetical protein
MMKTGRAGPKTYRAGPGRARLFRPVQTSSLRSAATTNYAIPRLRTKLGERSFSFAGPADLKALPADLRSHNVRRSKKQLKINCFQVAFNFLKRKPFHYFCNARTFL